MIRKSLLVLAGALSAFLIVEVAMRVAGWAWLSRQEQLSHGLQKEPGAIRILCLGESTTAPWVPDAQGTHSWPTQLEQMLQLRHPDLRIQVVNKGFPGTTSSVIVACLPDWLDKYDPQLVISMMGINDANPWYGIVKFNGGVRGTVPKFLAHLKTYKLLQYIRHESILKTIQKASQPSIESSYSELDQCRNLWKEFPHRPAEIEKVCLLAMRKRSKDPRPYAALGELYERLDRDEDPDRALQTAANLGSSEFQVYYQLAKHHQIENPGRAEKNYLTAIALASNPEAARKVYETLSKMYIIEGRYKEADAIFKKILALEPDYQQRPLTLAVSTGASATAANYRTLLELVRARGITLIAMQYARKDISDLRRLLGKQDGILFLSNKEIFEKALKEFRYEDLFLDRFGKTWGHCTRKGNQLIAANAAKTVDAWLADTKKRDLRSSWAPAEKHNLFEQEPKVAKDLTQKLLGWK